MYLLTLSLLGNVSTSCAYEPAGARYFCVPPQTPTKSLSPSCYFWLWARVKKLWCRKNKSTFSVCLRLFSEVSTIRDGWWRLLSAGYFNFWNVNMAQNSKTRCLDLHQRNNQSFEWLKQESWLVPWKRPRDTFLKSHQAPQDTLRCLRINTLYTVSLKCNLCPLKSHCVPQGL